MKYRIKLRTKVKGRTVKSPPITRDRISSVTFELLKAGHEVIGIEKHRSN